MSSEKKKVSKDKYTKPLLIKHKKLKDITGGFVSKDGLGCTRSF